MTPLDVKERALTEATLYELMGRLYVSWQLAVRERNEALAVALRRAQEIEALKGGGSNQ